MALSGSQKTRIGGQLSGVGIKQAFFPKAAGVIVDKIGLGVAAMIDAAGQAVDGSISSLGQSVASVIIEQIAVLGAVGATGETARGRINPNGQSIKGLIE